MHDVEDVVGELAVRAVRLGAMPDAKPDAVPPMFAEAVSRGEAKRDELFAIVDKKLQVVRGGLQRIAPKEVFFLWDDAERKVARARVYGVVIAQHGPKPDRMGQCLVRLKDGSSLWAAVTTLERGKLSMRLGGTLDFAPR